LRILSLILLFITPAFAGVPLTDNVLFAFEKCKSLSVDLEKGQLKEAIAPSFDVRCEKVPETKEDLTCSFYDQGSTKALSKEAFTGSSDLGVAELKDKNGRKMKFLIGKGYASYESGTEQKVCIGIYIFEKEALKRKSK
jgi:hypothetical protein